jgi:hypothetical protein
MALLPDRQRRDVLVVLCSRPPCRKLRNLLKLCRAPRLTHARTPTIALQPKLHVMILAEHADDLQTFNIFRPPCRSLPQLLPEGRGMSKQESAIRTSLNSAELILIFF